MERLLFRIRDELTSDSQLLDGDMALQATEPHLPRWYVFTVVALATFLVGLALWTSRAPRVHVIASIVQHLPDRVDSSGKDNSSAVVSQTDIADFTRLAEEQLAFPVEETNRKLTITRGESEKDAVTIHYVGADEDEALSFVNSLSRAYVAFMQKRFHRSIADRQLAGSDATATSRHRIAEAARQLDSFLAGNFRNLDQMGEARKNTDASSRTRVERRQKLQQKVTPDRGVVLKGHTERVNPAWSALNAKIVSKEVQREKLSVRFTPTHPNMKRLAATILELREQLGRVDKKIPFQQQDAITAKTDNLISPNALNVGHTDASRTTLHTSNEAEGQHRNKLSDERKAEFARLRENFDRARLQYEDSLRLNQQAQQDTLARSLGSIPSFQVERAYVVGGDRVENVWRLCGAGCLALCIGGYCATHICQRQRHDLLWDPIEAKDIMSLPVVGELVSPEVNAPPSFRRGKNRDRTVRLVTRASELVLATFVFAFLLTAFSDSRLTRRFLIDPCETFTQALSSQERDPT